MLGQIPWYIWFALGFFLGALAFSKKLRMQFSDLLNNMLSGKKTKKKKRRYYPEDDEDEEEPDDEPIHSRRGGNGRNEPRYTRGRRGTTIERIHFPDD